MEVEHVEELDHSPVAAAVGELFQIGAVRTNDVRVAVVMFTTDEEQPLSVGGPARDEVERVAGVDPLLPRPIRLGDKDLIILVIADPLAVGRSAVPVSEPGAVAGDIAFVAAVQVHDVGF